MTDDTYNKILKSYEENQKVQILRKIRGKRAFTETVKFLFPSGISEERTAWIEKFTDAERAQARVIMYRRLLRKNWRYGLKLVIPNGAEIAVIGEERAEA